jgi:hypothetical protein
VYSELQLLQSPSRSQLWHAADWPLLPQHRLPLQEFDEQSDEDEQGSPCDFFGATQLPLERVYGELHFAHLLLSATVRSHVSVSQMHAPNAPAQPSQELSITVHPSPLGQTVPQLQPSPSFVSFLVLYVLHGLMELQAPSVPQLWHPDASTDLEQHRPPMHKFDEHSDENEQVDPLDLTGLQV